jgi:hypothetical protein
MHGGAFLAAASFATCPTSRTVGTREAQAGRLAWDRADQHRALVADRPACRGSTIEPTTDLTMRERGSPKLADKSGMRS